MLNGSVGALLRTCGLAPFDSTCLMYLSRHYRNNVQLPSPVYVDKRLSQTTTIDSNAYQPVYNRSLW